ncbi:involucrin repeat protein [Cladophialophora carrionii]|uniref:Involucrin repeat protein n=1 Tax=Cladophialophora carrionii TaxID=86049 RepID=A0A1C1CJD7_9EURO|nr:involucrin repeat protein [Cladophialophora carrionii]
MQSFRNELRQSSGESADNIRSRYVPSSIYSASGPADHSPATGHVPSFMSGALRGPFEEESTPRLPPVQIRNAPRNSTLLNINDPVAMHLLAETAISDSREFEVLSFDEVEQLKKERTYLKAKVESTRRRLALESKVRDAAQSLNRLYSTRESPDGPGSPKKSRRSLLGSKRSENDAVHRADGEYAASMKKVEDLSRELFQLEKRLEHTERRILMHTAGILQMTHRGLKKNIRRNELPRSPESMTSHHGRGSVDFDERSLYQVPDYVTDFGHIPNKGHAGSIDPRAADSVASRLLQLNQRVHLMITQVNLQEHFDPPPQPTEDHLIGRVDEQIQAYLGYMSQGLDAMEAAQARSSGAMQQSIYDTEEQLEDVNIRLHEILQRTNSVAHSPVPQDEPRGKDLHSQLAFSASVVERLTRRIETLVEQKAILTRQIQQQRELNNRSEAHRDAKISHLMEEAEGSKVSQQLDHLQNEESDAHRELLSEQLHQARQRIAVLEQERAAGQGQGAGRGLEDNQDGLESQLQRLNADLVEKEKEAINLAASHAKDREEHAETTAALQKQIDDVNSAKSAAESEVSKLRQEMTELESEVVRAQTELTMVKAELDGAYGTRAQRAADVSMNPAVQKELDALNARNSELENQLGLLRKEHEAKDMDIVQLQNKVAALQTELKEMIGEYEAMTKQSIEDEKERERLEENVDAIQRRCEDLENQLNEEKVKSLGSSVSAPTDTTSAMVLRNEFRKMMRETRAENLKVLKAEREERRRLEGIIKSLKKNQQQLSTAQKPTPATPREPAMAT